MTEENIEYGKDLYVCYVKFQKAFNSAWRAGLWQVMRPLGYDENIIRLLKALCKDIMSADQLVQTTRRRIARLYPVSSALQNPTEGRHDFNHY